MAELSDIASYLDELLNIPACPDYPGAHNGLQLANDRTVTKVAAAVDASLPVIEKAIAAEAQLLVVHHGLFWQGVQALTGPVYHKFKLAMDAGLAIYSAHLPLDIHPEYGNNILLARTIGLTEIQPFGEWKGIPLGLTGSWSGSREDLSASIEQAVGAPPHLCPAGPESPKKVAIITGGAGSQVQSIVSEGCDTFVTGEGPHWSYPLAEELRTNLFYAGHYATETFGVEQLTKLLQTHYSLEQTFIDHPTGL